MSAITKDARKVIVLPTIIASSTPSPSLYLSLPRKYSESPVHETTLRHLPHTLLLLFITSLALSFTTTDTRCTDATTTEEAEYHKFLETLTVDDLYSRFSASPPSLPGLDIHPRRTRFFAYPFRETPKCSAMNSLLTVPLPPYAPDSVRNDPQTLSILDTYSDYFQLAPQSPYDIDALENALLLGTPPHPRPDLVRRFCDVMRKGVWPSHNGNFEEVRDMDYPKSKEEWRMVEERGMEGFEEGRMSEAYRSPIVGTTSSPSFFTYPEFGKTRQIIDPTGSRLNDGIDRNDVSPTYDLLPELVRLCRYLLSLRKEDRSRALALWKADVANAFWGIPVCPEWQLRQILRFLDDKGDEYFRVDWRLQFGSRASPFYWSIMEGFLLWLSHAQEDGIEFPLGYVDDNFGADDSQRFVRVETPEGGSILVPPAQARMLSTFTTFGAPWKGSKQLNNLDQTTGAVTDEGALEVLGFKINGREFTISIPQNQKERFALQCSRFKKGTRIEIADWRSLLGRATFLATVCPWAKYHLKLLYSNISKVERANPNRSKLRYSVKEEEERAIESFLDEILHSDKLSIFDPLLQIWPQKAMDLVIYADACGLAEGGVGGGLGFVLAVPDYSNDLTFYYRHSSPFVDNNYAEALAVYYALHYAILLLPPERRRRVLVFSDSSSTIYSLDAGKGNLKMLRLADQLFRLTRSHDTDYRIRHVKGENNHIADALSREFPSKLRRLYGENLFKFYPSMDHLGGTSP